ncbi:MAG TPA: choice-of-anchor Q domain-containing protein [Anaerolineae bacterium]|nr:choice-of-anchor Q domain-containing protein [Anaerolineae bacterium]
MKRVIVGLTLIIILTITTHTITHAQPFTPTATFVVNSTADNSDANTADNICADATGNCTLRAAIEQANANTTNDTINLSLTGTFNVNNVLNITSDIRINGYDQTNRRIDANRNTQIFYVSSAGTLTLQNVTVQEGQASFAGGGIAGGAIYNDGGNVTLSNCTFFANWGVGDTLFPGAGGAIYNDNNGTINITNCTFDQNQARVYYLIDQGATSDAYGGAIYNEDGNITISSSQFLTNTAYVNYANRTRGGAIYNTDSITIINTTFQGNTARSGNASFQADGGAIYNTSGGTLTIDMGTLFDHNEALGRPASGGAIYNLGNLNLTDSTFTYNQVDTSIEVSLGGALYNEGGLTIDNVSFSYNRNNDGNGHGGAIYNTGAGALIENSYFFDNHADGAGGALYNNQTLTTDIINIQFTDIISNYAGSSGGGVSNNQGTIQFFVADLTGNRADSLTGGAIFNNGAGRIDLDSSDIKLNTAGLRGGALGQYGQINILNTRIANNTAAEGGAIYAFDMDLHLDRTTLRDNTATTHGGAFYTAAGGATTSYDFVNSTISGNQANQNGGAIYHTSAWPLRLFNVTLTNNNADADDGNDGQGGGIYMNNGPVELQNSIVANNDDLSTGTFSLYAPDCYGTFTSNGYNLIGVDNGFCTITGDTTGNRVGLDPLLGPLTGTPPTYHLPLAGSPALNAGNDDGCRDASGSLLPNDQRLETRPLNGRCDIGAVELNCTSDPAIPPTLDIAISGDDIILTWSEHPENANHFIWRHYQDPYFPAEDAQALLLGAATNHTFTDTNALNLNTDALYYVISPHNDCNLLGPDSNTKAAFLFDLTIGN